jgi:hypothetical protein
MLNPLISLLYKVENILRRIFLDADLWSPLRMTFRHSRNNATILPTTELEVST